MITLNTSSGTRIVDLLATLGCTQGDRLLTVEDLVEWLGVPVATVYAWQYRRSGPPSYKVGRHLRFRRSDVEAWLETLRTEPRAPDLLRGLLGAKPVRHPVLHPARPRANAGPGFAPPPTPRNPLLWLGIAVPGAQGANPRLHPLNMMSGRSRGLGTTTETTKQETRGVGR